MPPTSRAPRLPIPANDDLAADLSFPAHLGPTGLGALPLDLCPFRAGSPGEASRLLAQGLVRPVIADVLVAADAPDSREIRAAATALLVPPDTRLSLGWVVGFGSAAWLHTGSGGTSNQPPANLQVIIPPGRRRPRSPQIQGRQIALSAEHVRFLGGIAVTDPIRTAADVARDLPPAEALPALRRLGALCEVRPHEVTSLLASMRYARGVAHARQLIRQWAEER